MKNMANKKLAMMGGDEVVANVGFSNKGVTESAEVEYPYCLRLYLGQEELEKLQLEKLPDIGSVINMAAKCKVVAIRQDEKLGSSLELQITDMMLGSPKKEKSAEAALYGEEEEE